MNLNHDHSSALPARFRRADRSTAQMSPTRSQLRRWWHSTHQPARFRRRTPRVSVIIAFWNAEPFLKEAIDSVFAQTFTDWELLLVDDGSTDASRLTAQRARARARDRVRILAHPGGANRGVPASRNVGMRHA